MAHHRKSILLMPRSPNPKSTAVARILSRADLLKSREELEQLTSGVLALKAKRVAPVASIDETRLLLLINEGVPPALTDRVQLLLAKRNDGRLTPKEKAELLDLVDEVERRGVERLEALAELAEVRGVSLTELMRSLGVAGTHSSIGSFWSHIED
jgi:hypothetical protein